MRLIDADKLKEELSYKSPAPDFDIDSVILGVIDEQPTVAASQWHRVEEPPKENGKYVAINVKTKWWYEASYENGNWKAVDLFGQRWVVIHPTHWMPVELQKEGNDGN